MAKVHKLPSDLTDQIAAGEVVERPSSVVKELVENALDAGARRVTVETEQSGLTRIRVVDDGEGMTEDDARLALERHATSKIARFDDLLALRTFGFRGEALPSVASVSRLTLVTRRHDAPAGVELVVEGGAAARVRAAGAAPGTSVEVADLFFNVPARRKFLKAAATESASIGEAVSMAALSRPDVTFVLSRDGKIAREYLRVTARAERAAQVLGGERLEACVGSRGVVAVEAHLGAPERARTGATGLHLLVNGRPVRDRALARAVAQAYGSVLEGGRYPLGVVYLDLPPELVDVNVHPQKAEVRFVDARGVFDALTRELHEALARAFAVPALATGPRIWSFNRPAATALPETRPLRETVSTGDPWGLVAPTTDGAQVSIDLEPTRPSNPTAPRELFAADGFYARLQYRGQLRTMYLLCEGADALYVLDQHAAAERVTFDRLRRAHASRAIAMQRLLVPEVVDLVPAEVTLLEEAASDIAGLGVELRAVGSNAVAVHGVPKLVERARPERIVRDILAELVRAAKRPFSDAADLVLATMACHGSVRGGDALSDDEARALLRALDTVDFAGHCPHGRPVVTRIPFEELERRVGR
jgi:DNA mismatch repair protein MutL